MKEKTSKMCLKLKTGYLTQCSDPLGVRSVCIRAESLLAEKVCTPQSDPVLKENKSFYPAPFKKGDSFVWA